MKGDEVFTARESRVGLAFSRYNERSLCIENESGSERSRSDRIEMEERSSVQREDRGDRKERKREKKISEEGRGRERGGRSDITSAKEAGGKGTALWLGCGR